MLRSLCPLLFVTGCALGLLAGEGLNLRLSRDDQSRKTTAAAEPISRGTDSPASSKAIFALRDLNGAPVAFSSQWLVVVFISPECPVANAELPVLNALAREFGPRGVTLVGAYADPTLAPDVLRRHAAESGLAFAVADDRAQQLAHELGATYTPEAFVFSREGQLLYRGRIDDRVQGFGPARPAAAHEDLRAVLAALVAGQKGPFPNQPGFGCALPEPVKP